MRFRPVEVLFSPTEKCNLTCPHCDIKRSHRVLSKYHAIRFLEGCVKAGIKKAGFTGGEPFLEPDFICAVTREALKRGVRFDRIMTNGVWWRSRKELSAILTGLRDAGYDGSLCVSVDAFHDQDIKKVALFVKTAVSVWRRPDIVSVAYVVGAKDRQTRKRLSNLAALLKGRMQDFGGRGSCIKSEGIFLKLLKIELSPIGVAAVLKNPWDGKWFREDRCRGPGNVLFILSNGDIKPCCGYATGSRFLTIGNIKNDSFGSAIKNAANNRFVRIVYSSGLSAMRKRLERSGFKFPGKTSNHCFFCHYLLNDFPQKALNKILDKK